MDFIANYWVLLLVAFILVMLVMLSYLIDREVRNMKNNDEIDNEEMNVELKNNYDKDDVVPKSEALIVNDKVEDNKDALDYDELDVEDIDDDFNKVIPKKKIIDTSIKDSVEAMVVNGLNIKNEEFCDNIELPDIKIKKDINSDIWD